MTDILIILCLAAVFIGFGFLTRGKERRGCGGCQIGEFDKGAEKK
jgi:hypothetical protein